MVMKHVLFLLLFYFVTECECDNNGPIVATSQGQIRGQYRNSHGGRTFASFEGIPYAKPPIGNLRFEPPEPQEPWTDVLNANFTTLCPQTNMRNQSQRLGQEDCLYINVYVPKTILETQNKSDVIVHIHGGAFIYGGGHVYAHPDFIMDRDVVFVTFNYRLGIFGFLSTQDEVVPGNNGLKDQVMALAWVQANIDIFGGNPDSVTLTGLSAGGASVHLHYFSKMSRGLFHKGFSQSGVALNFWTIQKEPLTKAKILAKALECPLESTRALVECLKSKPYKDLLNQMGLFFGYKVFPMVPFGPVVENGKEAFLDKDPYWLLSQGQVLDVPWLVSVVSHEGLLMTGFLEDDMATVNGKWQDLAPILLDYNYTLTYLRWKSVAQKVKKFYVGENVDFDKENFQKFVKMFSDRYFLVDTEIAVKLQANFTKSDVFYYYFSYSGDTTTTVGHGDDRKYFFGDFLPNSRPLSGNELKMKNVVLDMLISFAKKSKPEIDGVRWDATDSDKVKYLHISTFEKESMKMETIEDLSAKRFWKSLGFLENENLIVSGNECC